MASSHRRWVREAGRCHFDGQPSSTHSINSGSSHRNESSSLTGCGMAFKSPSRYNARAETQSDLAAVLASTRMPASSGISPCSSVVRRSLVSMSRLRCVAPGSNRVLFRRGDLSRMRRESLVLAARTRRRGHLGASRAADAHSDGRRTAGAVATPFRPVRPRGSRSVGTGSGQQFLGGRVGHSAPAHPRGRRAIVPVRFESVCPRVAPSVAARHKCSRSWNQKATPSGASRRR